MNPKTGLYSKAAKIIRSLPQERGTVDQFIGAARKLGLKDVELAHAGNLPTGPILRDELAALFEDRLPKLRIDQLGENPPYLQPHERQRHREIGNRLGRHEQVSPDEEREYLTLQRRTMAGPNVMTRTDDDDNEEPLDTEYGSYASDGTQNYRERLLKLDQRQHPAVRAEEAMRSLRVQINNETPIYGADHPIIQDYQKRLGELQQERDTAIQQIGAPKSESQRYYSSHWSGHPDVLAHIRLSDRGVGEDREAIRPAMQRLAQMAGVSSLRDLGSGAVHVGLQNGVISPQEAASISRIMHWYTGHENKPGIGKRLLHVEELQSDWGQEGRDQGFNDGSAMKAYRDHVEDMRSRMRQSLLDKGLPENVARPLYEKAEPWHLAKFHGEEEKLNSLRDAVNDQQGKVPAAPYVTNTQHWTDLALKNVLREAALGNYDGIVFSSGQNNADRYGLEKQLDRLQYSPQMQTLAGTKNGNWVINKQNVKPEDLHGLLGKDLTERLMHPDNIRNAGATNQFHELQGDDLKMGGQGMRGYYDGIVPKSVMRLAQMHDPDIRPAEPVLYGEDGAKYQGFHLPMTDKLRQGILNDGFPAFRRGGAVDVGRALALTRRFTKKP